MIKLILGSMFSGKSSEMIRLLVRAQIAGKSVILLRPKIDDRGFLTHDNKAVDILEVSVDKIIGGVLNILDYDVIGIDEGQFFQYPNAVRDINILADKGKEIIVTALNGTSERGTFDTVQGLIPYAEDIIKLNAICTDCGSEYGAYSYYLAGDKQDKVKVGDSSEYTALCRRCYNNRMNKT